MSNLIQRVNVGDSLTRTAAARPTQRAVVDGEREWTYAELNAWVNRVAHGLAARVGGEEFAVLLPATEDEVTEVLRYCSQHRIAVVPFGGGTSVVGGLDPIRGEFDAVVVTVGTCGAPRRIEFPGLPDSHSDASGPDDEKREGEEDEVFKGDVLHSSELDNAKLEGKHIIVIGSGASGVEAVETALEKGAKGCVMLARDDKVRNTSITSALEAECGRTVSTVDHPPQHRHRHFDLCTAVRARDATLVHLGEIRRLVELQQRT